jgi:hypothetical protein
MMTPYSSVIMHVSALALIAPLATLFLTACADLVALASGHRSAVRWIIERRAGRAAAAASKEAETASESPRPEATSW